MLSVILVRRYGLLGVAIGTAVPVFIANLFVLAPAACRQMGVGVFAFARSVAVAPLVGTLLAALCGSVLRATLPPQSLPLILGEGAMVGLVYLAAVWMLGFDHDIRERYTAFGRRMFDTALNRRTAESLV